MAVTTHKVREVKLIYKRFGLRGMLLGLTSSISFTLFFILLLFYNDFQNRALAPESKLGGRISKSPTSKTFRENVFFLVHFVK
jgi:hypothetical protein